MTTIKSRRMKRIRIENQLTYPISKSIKRQLLSHSWSIQNSKKFKKNHCNDDEQQQQEHLSHCQIYLKFFPSTLKCSLDVVVQSNNKSSTDYHHENDSILIAKTRIPKVIKAGVIRVRLVSSLFTADSDVHEDPLLTKFETIPNDSSLINFDKQFALVLKNTRIGPGPIGKFYLEWLDPSNGSYTSNPPIFELNLNLSYEHEILLTYSHEKNAEANSPLQCGCVLSSNSTDITISDQCNLMLNNMKLIHRLSEPLRCVWKSIGRELFPCFNEMYLNDINQRYFLLEGNQECTYQLLREWFVRDPNQANIRYLLTRLKLPFDLILTIHNDIIQTFISSSV